MKHEYFVLKLVGISEDKEFTLGYQVGMKHGYDGSYFIEKTQKFDRLDYAESFKEAFISGKFNVDLQRNWMEVVPNVILNSSIPPTPDMSFVEIDDTNYIYSE